MEKKKIKKPVKGTLPDNIDRASPLPELLDTLLDYYRSKRIDEAVAAYSQAIALKPDYAEAQNNLGITLQMMKKP